MAVCSKGLLEIHIYIGNQVAIYLTNIHTVNQDNQYNFGACLKTVVQYIYILELLILWVNMQNPAIRAYVIILKAALSWKIAD